MAQALTAYEAMLCSGCGQPIHESMDIESDGEWSAPEPMRCHACTAIAERAASYSEARAPQALKFNAERKPRASLTLPES